MKTKANMIFVCFILAFISQGCQNIQDALSVQKPKASLKGLKFDDISLQSATVLFDVELENPYQVPLPLLNMDYNVASDESELFSGQADLQTTIPAKESKTVSLPAKISYLDLVRAFKGIRPGSKVPYNADLGLSVEAPILGSIRLPIKKTGELSVPSIPKIDEIDWKQLIDKASQL